MRYAAFLVLLIFLVTGYAHKHETAEAHDKTTVFDEAHRHDEEHKAEQAWSGISLLKEQQLMVDFMVGLPIRQRLASSFAVTGEVIPVSHADAVLSSPFSGILSLSKPLPHIGKNVVKGEVLAVVEPPISQQSDIGKLTASYAEAKNRITLAQNELKRAKRLYEAKAVPKRRLEEAKLGLESAQAAFEPLQRVIRKMKQHISEDKALIKAPFSGTVVEMLTANGKAIAAGQPVLRLINTTSVWLRANVPATEISGLRNFERSTFTVPGIKGELRPSRLVTVSNAVDPRTRTVPVIFEVGNKAGLLKVGMFANVSIKTGYEERTLTLPDEALFEDEGRFFVFVQREGELFERREVQVGIQGGGIAQILAGIKEDERVVIRGGYYVKLASLASRLPLPDCHAGHH